MDNKLPLIETRLISNFVAIAETGCLQNKQVRQLSINWDEFSQQIPLMLFFRLDYAYPLIKQQLVEGLQAWFGYQEGV